MADPDRPLFADAGRHVSRLAGDVRRMAELRWQLARLELEASTRRLVRLAILSVASVAMIGVSLPILVVSAAWFLPEPMRPYFLLVLGAVGLCAGIVGVAVGVRAWRRLRCEQFGLEETLEELREDAVWLREWTERADGNQGPGE